MPDEKRPFFKQQLSNNTLAGILSLENLVWVLLVTFGVGGAYAAVTARLDTHSKDIIIHEKIIEQHGKAIEELNVEQSRFEIKQRYVREGQKDIMNKLNDLDDKIDTITSRLDVSGIERN